MKPETNPREPNRHEPQPPQDGTICLNPTGPETKPNHQDDQDNLNQILENSPKIIKIRMTLYPTKNRKDHMQPSLKSTEKSNQPTSRARDQQRQQTIIQRSSQPR